MITNGTTLRLHGKGLHRIEEIGFKIGEYTGNWFAYVKMTDLETNKIEEIPLWMVEELLKNGNLYEHGKEELMARYHEAVNGKKVSA